MLTLNTEYIKISGQIQVLQLSAKGPPGLRMAAVPEEEDRK